MKWAKVVDGVVHHVWPHAYVKEHGTFMTPEVPPQVASHQAKGLPIPDCFVQVPDHVEPKMRFNGQDWVKPPKKEARPKARPHSDLLEVVAEKLGVPYDDLWAEVQARKKERRATQAALRGLTPPKPKG